MDMRRDAPTFSHLTDYFFNFINTHTYVFML